MHDESNDQAQDGGGVLLMKTWNDGEAETVRQILANHDIPCQVVSDVPHSVLPITVDGLGEIRVLVSESKLGQAKTLLAEYRRQGLEIVPGGKRDDPDTPDTADPEGEGS